MQRGDFGAYRLPIARSAPVLNALPADSAPDAASRVLRAALPLFAAQGFHGTSIRDIAHAAGIQSASLYAHYPSKEHILGALVRIGHEEHHRMLRSALVHSEPGAASQLRAVVGAHVRFHATHALLATVINNEMHALSAPLAAPGMTLRRQSEGLLGEVIERGIATSEFDVVHPWMTMAAIGGMGIRVAAWYRPDGPLGSPATPQLDYSVDEVVETYTALALRMVGARDT